MSKAVVFLDTNIFLHFQPFDQIGWTELLGVEEVELAIAPIVVRELDNHKDHHKLSAIRDRARAALKKIESSIVGAGSPTLTDGVSVSFADEPLLSFEEHGLKPEVSDDHLIACCIERASDSSGARVIVYTDDTGPRIKAHKHSIEAVSPDDALRLPSASEGVERQNQELRRRVQQLESSLPNLQLGLSDGSQNLMVTLDAPYSVDPEKVEAKIRELEERYPEKHPEPEPPPVSPTSALQEQMEQIRRISAGLGGLNRITPEEYDRYNADRSEFIDQYRSFLEGLAAQRNREILTVEIQIVLFNRGTAPAEDIDVFMHFPDGFTLLEEDDLPEAAKPPSPPREPRKIGDALRMPSFLSQTPFISPDLYNFPIGDQNISSPSIRKTNSYDVSYSVGKLKQHLEAPCDRLFANFESFDSVAPFRIDYRINAANIPHEIEGSLNVVVRTQPHE